MGSRGKSGDLNSALGRSAVRWPDDSAQYAASPAALVQRGLLLARDLALEPRHIPGVRSLDHVGGHRSVAEARLLAALGRVLDAAVLDRVQRELEGRLDHVEVRADLAHGVGRRERVAQTAALAEDLAAVLVGRGQLDPADL